MSTRNRLNILIEPRSPGIIIPLILGAFLWTFPYIFSNNYELWPSQNTLFVTFINNLLDFNPFLSGVIGFLFTVLMGFLLVQLNKTYSFIRIRSLLLFFFYILLIGTNISLHTFNFSQISSLFLLISLWQLFSIYDKKQSVIKTFNIGFFLAIGSFFSLELLLFVPVFFIGIQRLKGLTSRTFLATCIGLLTPFVLFLSIAYLTDNNISAYITSFFNQFQFGVELHYDYISIAYLLTLLLTALVSLLNILNNPFSDKIKVGRMLGFISLGFLFFVLLFFVKSNSLQIIFTLGTLFSTILYTHYFSLRPSIFTRIIFFLQIIICFIYYITSVFSLSL